jgi:hypothetical protein
VTVRHGGRQEVFEFDPGAIREIVVFADADDHVAVSHAVRARVVVLPEADHDRRRHGERGRDRDDLNARAIAFADWSARSRCGALEEIAEALLKGLAHR